MSLFEFTGVSKVNDGFTLNVGDLVIDSGGALAITGPNGCGKSTFLNLISLVAPPDRGRVTFLGREVDFNDSRELRGFRRRISYLMQSPYLFRMSVGDNIGYGLKIRKTQRQEIKKRVEEAMEKLSLSGLEHRFPSTLSGGEAQRVALARTLVLDADVYLLDEPTSNVDVENVAGAEGFIQDTMKRTGAALILTTHSIEQSRRLAAKSFALEKGRVCVEGRENVFKGILRKDQYG